LRGGLSCTQRGRSSSALCRHALLPLPSSGAALPPCIPPADLPHIPPPPRRTSHTSAPPAEPHTHPPAS
jgi:hypothetical protein